MYQKIQKISVKGIFEREGKILFVKDPKGVWELPGGRIEHGENPQLSLLRELNEELGWKKITIEDLIDAWSFISKIQDRYNHFIILVYSCQSNEKNIKQNEEYIDHKWISITEIKDFKMKKGYKNSIKKYLYRKLTK